MECNVIGNFRYGDPSEHIHNIVLFGHLGRYAYKNGKQAGKDPVRFGNLLPSANTDKTKPAYQTVDGRKKIRRCIHLIYSLQ